MFKKLAGWVSKAGTTPKGKAFEHAVVAAVALVASSAATMAFSGNVRGALVLVGTAALAGVRAWVKEVTK